MRVDTALKNWRKIISACMCCVIRSCAKIGEGHYYWSYPLERLTTRIRP